MSGELPSPVVAATPRRINRGNDSDESSIESIPEPGSEEGSPQPSQTESVEESIVTMSVLHGQEVDVRVRGQSGKVVGMGNLGKDPSKLVTDRTWKRKQLRPSMQFMDLMESEMEPIPLENRYEFKGKLSLNVFWEDISRELIKYGKDHVIWVRQTDGSYLHIKDDYQKITIEMIEEYIKYIKDTTMPIGTYAEEDQYETGQVLLKSIGTEARKTVIAGGTTNLMGTEVLYKLLEEAAIDSVTTVAEAAANLNGISIVDSPNMDFGEVAIKVFDALAGVISLPGDTFQARHLGGKAVQCFYGSDEFYREHIPPLMQSEVLELYKKHSKEQCSYSVFERDVKKMTSVCTRLTKQKKFAPMKWPKRSSKEAELEKTIKGFTAAVGELKSEITAVKNGNNNNDKVMSQDGKYELKANGAYSNQVWWNVFTPKDREIVNEMRKQDPQRGRKGKDGSKIPDEKLFDPTPEELEKGHREIVVDGVTKKLWWCSDCRGKDDGAKGKFTLSHGDKHKKKHDPEYGRKQRECSQRGGPTNPVSTYGAINPITNLTAPPPPAPEPELPPAEESGAQFIPGMQFRKLHDAAASYDAYMARQKV